MEKAPTNPKESANDDFTIEITSITVTEINTNVCINFFLLDNELPLDHLKSLKLWDVFVLTVLDSGQILLKRVDAREEQFEPVQLELDI